MLTTIAILGLLLLDIGLHTYQLWRDWPTAGSRPDVPRGPRCDTERPGRVLLRARLEARKGGQ